MTESSIDQKLFTEPQSNNETHILNTVLTNISWAQKYVDTAKSVPKIFLGDKNRIIASALSLLGLFSMGCTIANLAKSEILAADATNNKSKIELKIKTPKPKFTKTPANTATLVIKTPEPSPTPTKTPTLNPNTPIPADTNLRATSEALTKASLYTSFIEAHGFTNEFYDEISKNEFSIIFENGKGGLAMGSATFFKTGNPDISACITTATHTNEGATVADHLTRKMEFKQVDRFGNISTFTAKPYYKSIDARRDQTIFCFHKSANPDVDFPDGVEVENEYEPSNDEFLLAVAYPGSFQANSAFHTLGTVVEAKNKRPNDSQHYFLPTNVSGGASGGGVFNLRGNLVGTIVGEVPLYFGQSTVLENSVGIAKVTIIDEVLPPDLKKITSASQTQATSSE